MWLLIPIVVVMSTAMPIQEAIQITRARQAALDKLRVEVAAFAYHAADAANWQDEASWTLLSDPSFQASHMISIVRPDVLYERPLFDPPAGSYPIRIFLTSYGYTTEYSIPDEEGFTHFAVARRSADVLIPMPGPLSFTPVLWMFDAQFPDQCPLLLNTLTVLEQPGVTATLLENGLTRFSADIPSSSLPLRCAVDLNARGTPVHSEVRLLFEGVPAATLELFVDSTVEVEGFELPLTARTVVRNPNIAPPYNAMACIWRQQVLGFELIPGMSRSEIEIIPPTRNSVVATKVYGTALTTEAVWYDDSGHAVRYASQTFSDERFASNSDRSSNPGRRDERRPWHLAGLLGSVAFGGAFAFIAAKILLVRPTAA
ncbi:MAG: hypothetical protein JNG88_10345 [Phycisphaerales bacterium]|nr:hypothetical protein [Phycisphaerales bacterium]